MDFALRFDGLVRMEVWSAARSRQRNAALRLWTSQLAANGKWSKLFFGEHRPLVALADIIALEGTIWTYINAARRVDRAAANAFILRRMGGIRHRT
ncbi:MAG TPA: TspO/MBR family protein [Candidatus Acidoferrum sp.]|nr:TspO/MBR family protein [Candidatus Acidoferrum sp.]